MGAGCTRRLPARDGDCVASPLPVSAGTTAAGGEGWRGGRGSGRRRRARRWGLWALAQEVRMRRAKGNQRAAGWNLCPRQTHVGGSAVAQLAWDHWIGTRGVASNGTAEPLATHGGEHVRPQHLTPRAAPCLLDPVGNRARRRRSLWAARPARCTDSHLSCPHAGSASCSVLYGPQGPEQGGRGR